MTWRYRASHRTITTPGGETEDAIAPDSDTKDGLIEVLQMMLKNVQEFDVLEVGE